MEYGVCGLTLIPVRAKHSHTSEMVTQILFGETFKILEKKDKWVLVELMLDQYQGWIDEKQMVLLNQSNFFNILENSEFYSIDIVRTARSIYKEHPILLGSPLPFYRQKQFSFFDDKFSFEGNVVNLLETTPNRDKIKEIAMIYLNAPYLWGGRSPLGIDCSGFTQMVYRLNGIKIARDSKDQAAEESSLIKINTNGRSCFFCK